MGAWQAWHEKAGDGVLDLGAALDKSTTVTRDSSASGRTTVTGYSFLQAESIEEAAALMKGHPHFFMPGGSAQILECIPMPGL